MASADSKLKMDVEISLKYNWWLILYLTLMISLASFAAGAYYGRITEIELWERFHGI